MAKKNILIINTQERGGAANACVRLHEGLVENNTQSSLLTLYKSEKIIKNHIQYDYKANQGIKNRIKERFNKLYNPLLRLDEYNQKLDSIADYFSFIDTVYEIENSKVFKEASVINLHWVGNFINWPTFFKRSTCKKIVWTIHDMSPFTGGYHYSGGFRGYEEFDKNCPLVSNSFDPKLPEKSLKRKKEILNRYNQKLTIVSPSQWLLECSKHSSLFNSYPHYCIPNGVNTSVFKPIDKNIVRQKFNIKEDEFVLLFIADFITNRRKGFDILLEALRKLPKNDKLVLMAIGSNSQIPDFGFKYIHVDYVQSESVLNTLYNCADLFVIPSREENLPNTVLEAMSSQVPVIGFSIGGIPEMVKENHTGFLVKPFDTSELAYKIEKVMSEKEILYRMGEKGRELVISKFTIKKQVDSYLALFDSL